MKRGHFMRVTGYKLGAKSLINDNLGKCFLMSSIFVFPKVVFVLAATILFLGYRADMLHGVFFALGISVAVVVLFVLNAVCVPFGELALFRLASGDEADVPLSLLSDTIIFDIYDEAEAESYVAAERDGYDEFRSIAAVLRRFGLARLLRLRLCLLGNLARDVALTALPAGALVALLLLGVVLVPLPTGAFVALCIGSFAILLLAVMELGLEYDKYRYVYITIPEIAADFSSYSFPYKFMLGKSIEKAGESIREIRHCEVSFWGWSAFVSVTALFLVPILYFLSYKKLTFYYVIIRRQPSYNFV